MIDTHYDLLTICYVCYLNNDYSKIKKYSKEIINSGVEGIFANLYFMSIDEMKYELHDNYYSNNKSILEMFKISKSILEYYLPNTKFLYSIEGCDYLNINDLESLYDNGLRSILLVWNNQNKYASGNRGSIGLTNEGRKFISRAIDLGIGIDLSHANIKTFNDMVNIIKEKYNNGQEVITYASHSNSRYLRNIDRNLTDEQIINIRDINGNIGVISNNYFIKQNVNSRKEYIKHIKYICDLIGVDRVMLSTDDMRFAGDKNSIYLTRPIYNYETISKDIRSDLLNVFNEEDANKIMYENANKIIKRLNKRYIFSLY